MNQKLIHIGVNYLNKKSHSIFHIPQIYCNISNLVVFIQYSFLNFLFLYKRLLYKKKNLILYHELSILKVQAIS